MNCPSCGSPELQAAVGICPSCHAPLSAAPQVDTQLDLAAPQAKSWPPVGPEDKAQLPDRQERRELMRRSLLDMGYVLQNDGRGVRLTQIAIARTRNANLSPTDIVRLAAEMDDGLLPPEQRIRCPKCDAVINAQDTRCQWCSEPLQPAA